MKRVTFLTVLLMSMLVCGIAFAADITGTYAIEEAGLKGEMIIRKSGSGYIAEINTYVPDSPPPGMWSGFEGKGTLKENVLTVAQDKNGHHLQISIKFNGNIATIEDADVIGNAEFFGGPSAGPEFSYTYKKKRSAKAAQ
jgi:hypothetical protein